MQKSKKAESLVGIVIGIFILSFVLIGIGNLIGISKQDIGDFNEKMQIDILKQNTAKIVDNLSLNSLNNGDIFYLYKNPNSKEFEIKTDNSFKYIDQYGNTINDINNFDGKIFERSLKLNIINFNGITYYNTQKYINLINK